MSVTDNKTAIILYWIDKIDANSQKMLEATFGLIKI